MLSKTTYEDKIRRPCYGFDAFDGTLSQKLLFLRLVKLFAFKSTARMLTGACRVIGYPTMIPGAIVVNPFPIHCKTSGTFLAHTYIIQTPVQFAIEEQIFSLFHTFLSLGLMVRRRQVLSISRKLRFATSQSPHVGKLRQPAKPNEKKSGKTRTRRGWSLKSDRFGRGREKKKLRMPYDIYLPMAVSELQGAAVTG